jgi:hypothetical protein
VKWLDGDECEFERLWLEETVAHFKELSMQQPEEIREPDTSVGCHEIRTLHIQNIERLSVAASAMLQAKLHSCLS